MVMLARTAENLFWMARYVERAENIARMLHAASRISRMALAYPSESNEWESALQAAACAGMFHETREAATQQEVISFLVFDEDNPSSIASCLRTARRNARSVRTALTLDTWEAVNSGWLEFRRFDQEDFSPRGLDRLIGWVKETCLRIDGSAVRTMLRNDPFWFFRLGVFLERAETTARILDVKYHLLLPEHERVGGGLDYYQWTAILRAVSAHSAYHWVYRQSLKPWLIADLLILREQMPRSLASCYANLADHLDNIARLYGHQGPSQRHARATIGRLRNARIEDIFQSGLHEFLVEFIADNNRLGQEIYDQYLS